VNPDELDLPQAANNFHRIADEDNCIISSDDFVIINRYGGKMCDCDWVTGNDDEYSTFFWMLTQVKGNRRSIRTMRLPCQRN